MWKPSSIINKYVVLNSDGDGNSRLCLLECDIVYFSTWVPTFQRNMLPPFTGQKMNAIDSSEMLVSIYRII
jgi:hypothetical protein